MIDLAKLPKDHPLRNMPLAKIGAKYKHPSSEFWRPVLPSFGIANLCYNDLGPVWTETAEWVCE